MILSFDSSKWSQVWVVSPQSREKVVCPILLSSRVIALLISTPSIATPATQYQLGAFVQRETFTGLTVGGSPDARLDGARKLYFNRLQIFTYNVVCEYTLTANCFAYGGGVRLFGWEYTGVIN